MTSLLFSGSQSTAASEVLIQLDQVRQGRDDLPSISTR